MSPLAFQLIYGSSDERGENGDGEEGSERLPGLFYANGLVLCSLSSEEELGDMLLRLVGEEV